eukprot:5421531-Prymnesium_polylepis.1
MAAAKAAFADAPRASEQVGAAAAKKEADAPPLRPKKSKELDATPHAKAEAEFHSGLRIASAHASARKRIAHAG